MSANDFYSSGDQSNYDPKRSSNQGSSSSNDEQQDRGLLSTVAGGVAGGWSN